MKVARLSVKSSMKTQSIKLNYKSHKRDFIKTSTVCFASTAHQEVILIQYIIVKVARLSVKSSMKTQSIKLS